MDYKDLENEWLGPRDYIIAHTSGSTGSPKEIRLPKVQVEASAMRSIRFFGLSSSSLLYSCVSPDFIGGKMVWIRAKLCGCRFDAESPSLSPLKDYHGDPIDLISVVPAQMIYILDHPELHRFIRKVLIGGAPVSEPMRRRIMKAGIEAYESYGMTETASHIALRRISVPQHPFRLLPGISARMEEGMRIEIEGWEIFHTHDIAEFVAPDAFHILGRSDNVIISGGKKIFPERIEELLEDMIRSPFYITSSTDPQWGERVVLAIADPVQTKEEVLEICRKTLPRHWVPKEIRVIKEIPRTPNGKIKRHI